MSNFSETFYAILICNFRAPELFAKYLCHLNLKVMDRAVFSKFISVNIFKQAVGLSVLETFSL